MDGVKCYRKYLSGYNPNRPKDTSLWFIAGFLRRHVIASILALIAGLL